MYQARNQENANSALWQLGLPRSINMPRRKIWPVSGKPVLVE